MSARTDTTREAVERLAQFHALSVELYDAEEESGLRACAHVTAATLRALLAERDARAWQPIETAPRDGRPVLAWGPTWHTAETVTHDPGAAGWQEYPSRDFVDLGCEPTHWQPLPEPPKDTTDGR